MDRAHNILLIPKAYQVFCLFLVITVAAAADPKTDGRVICYPEVASAEDPTPYPSSPGIAAFLVTPKDHRLIKIIPNNITFYLKLESSFYKWAVAAGIFNGEGPTFSYSKNSSPADVQAWCEKPGACRNKASAASRQPRCCIHSFNVHFCTAAILMPICRSESSGDAGSSPGATGAAAAAPAVAIATTEIASDKSLLDCSEQFCTPWLPLRGTVSTHSDSLFGPASRRYWIVKVENIKQLDEMVLLAVFKVGGAKCITRTLVSVVLEAECGDNICNHNESCDTCTEDCGECAVELNLIVIYIFVAIALSTICGIVLIYMLHRKTARDRIHDNSWIIKLSDMSCASQAGGGPVQAVAVVLDNSNEHGQVAAVKVYQNTVFQLNDQIRKEVSDVRRLDHPNVCKFVGGTVEPGLVYILTEYCPKGSLMDVLQNESIPLNWAFRFSMLMDVTRGMSYLHVHDMVHGNLKSTNCVVDDRWTCKITDYGLHEYRFEFHNAEHEDDQEDEESWDTPSKVHASSDFVYRAPETYSGGPVHASDVYSFAMIMVEVATREHIYVPSGVTPSASSPWKPIIPTPVEMDVNGSRRGTGDSRLNTNRGLSQMFVPRRSSQGLKSGFIFSYQELIAKCWDDKPWKRPTFDMAGRALSRMNPSKRNAVDTMMDLMQSYSKNLEVLVNQRSKQLLEEKAKTDKLLYSILPRRVADDLKNGNQVTAEWFECATIFFSDIVAFTDMSAGSSPMQIVCFLNNLYTMFDSIIECHQVYKVETIGDAYMVVSGVPERTDKHACYVAMMSLEILSSCKNFVIPHVPERPLLIRIGVASGSVCAGVVGIKMPRYCLFGDTVNTASRMESHSKSNRIHISEDTYYQLLNLDCFSFEAREKISVKGKGMMQTYWLTGKIRETGQDTLASCSTCISSADLPALFDKS